VANLQDVSTPYIENSMDENGPEAFALEREKNEKEVGNWERKDL
jgi:hypothetical protein